MTVVFLEMTKQVKKHGISFASATIEILTVRKAHRRINYMSEEFFAEILEQIIFCFEVSVKNCSANVGINDLSYDNLIIVFFSQKFYKCFKI